MNYSGIYARDLFTLAERRRNAVAGAAVIAVVLLGTVVLHFAEWL